MEQEAALLVLMAVATVVASLARLVRIPYAVALVAAGLVLGTTSFLTPPKLTKDFLYAVILPGLLFEAAFHLDVADFRRNKLAILGLAVPGVIAAVGLTGVIVALAADAVGFAPGMRLIDGLVLASILAATDPIAVMGIFKSLGVPKRLAILLEGESLLNDGTGIVFFGLLVGIAAGGPVSAGAIGLDFVRVVGLGAGIGLGIGYLISRAIHRIDDAMIEITLTTVAAYAPFLVAEHFHGSGVIASVVSGMLCGNFAARTGMSPTTRVAVLTFWEYVAFALNTIVFLLIGFEVHPERLVNSWVAIVITYLAVLLARAAVVMASSLLLARTRERLPWSWSAVLTWGGMRGALSMVLALSLVADFPQREVILTTTFGVVLLSLLIQGLTLSPLLKLIGLGRKHERHLEYERLRAKLQAANAALAELDEVAKRREVHVDVVAKLRATYTELTQAAEAGIQDLHLEKEELRNAELHRVGFRLLMAEKDGALRGVKTGLYSHEAASALIADIDARLQRLEEDTAAGGH